MFKYDYLKVAVASPNVKLGKPLENAKHIVDILNNTIDASIILFPELALIGSTLGDWNYNASLLNEQNIALNYLKEYSNEQIIIVGGSFQYLDSLYNVAYVIQNGYILGIVPKVYLDVEQRRNFTSGEEFVSDPVTVEFLGEEVLFGNVNFINSLFNISFGIEIGQDLGLISEAQIIFNLNSDTYYLGKNEEYETMVKATSIQKKCCYILTSVNASETASDLLYNGQMLAYEYGELLLKENSFNFDSNVQLIDVDIEYLKFIRYQNIFNQLTEPFIEFDLETSEDYQLTKKINSEPFVIKSDEQAKEIIDVLTTSLYHRLNHIGISKVVIGVSGGLDSTLALLVAHQCFTKYNIPTSNILAFSMPALATGSKSQQIALDLMNELRVKGTVLPIGNEIKSHFDLINHDENVKNTTYENVQARYRTLVLMNVSNSEKAIVLGTGDMSEIALGWSTFNGDQMSMYNINAGLPKTAIRSLVSYFTKIYPNLQFVITDVINATITPELTSSSQSTEEIIGKYEVNDFILYQIFGRGASYERVVYLLEQVFNFDNEKAVSYYNNFMRRFKQNQFKRLASPEGVRIFKLSLSPHGALKFSGDLK